MSTESDDSGIMVPMVNTAETARDIIQWSKFPPMGARGQGSSFSAMASGLSLPEYIRTANRTILTAVQIETPEAVANAEAIAAVDGIDALFIGPNDLALTLLGYVPARWDEVPFLEAIEKVRQAGAKHGKHVGILARNAAHAKQLADNDWTWVAIGTDVRALQEAMTSNIAIARGKK